MRLIKIAAAAAALGLASSPALAQSSAPAVEDEADNAGRITVFVVLGLIALVIAVVGIGGSDNQPVSP